MIGFVVRGTKNLAIGGRVYRVTGPSYYLVPVHLPATATVRGTPGGQPYLSVGLEINRNSLRGLLRDLPVDMMAPRSVEFGTCEADADFLGAWLRLLRLTRKPGDIPALAPLYEREILYRVLTGAQGPMLRQLGLRDSGLSRISEVVRLLREEFLRPIDIKTLASKANMGVTTFHRQFKRATGQSPVQFQKQLRLLEARRLLVMDGATVSGAAHDVGYRARPSLPASTRGSLERRPRATRPPRGGSSRPSAQPHSSAPRCPLGVMSLIRARSTSRVGRGKTLRGEDWFVSR